ncbi:MAG TPA: fibronectin type III domain-containing protein [Bryobacteraceae bacterium]|jgi:hypothetical protein|nr:fibronectin type III domain-containing protein [Bryobacteraceae bacterium]
MGRPVRTDWKPLRRFTGRDSRGGLNTGPESGSDKNLPATLNDVHPVVITLEVRPRRRLSASMAALIGIGLVVLSGSGVWFAMHRGALGNETPKGSAALVKASVTTASASNIGTTSATIVWSTKTPMTSQVQYGTSDSYGLLSGFDSRPVTSHSVVLTGLTPGTRYDCAALSMKPGGVALRSSNLTFSTASAAGTPSISNLRVSETTPQSARVAWTTDQPSASQIQYGGTTAYGSLSMFNASLVTEHSVNLTGLTPGITYNASALAANSSGHVGVSENFVFTTPATGGIPVVSQATVSEITPTSARITWNTDQPAASQIEYGETTKYGFLSAFNPSLVKSHSMTLTGLVPGRNYNSSALSTSAAGQVGRSPNFTFATAAAPPVIHQPEAGDLADSSVTIEWTTDQPSTSQVAYGTTTAYGALSPVSPALVVSHSVTLNGLQPGTAYHAAAMSANAAGMANSAPDMKFITPARSVKK